MNPAEETELLLQVAFLQGHDKAHKSNNVQREADNTVICGKGQEVGVCKDNVLYKKLVNKTTLACFGLTLK